MLKTDQEIEAIADRTRNKLGVSDLKCPDLVDLVKKLVPQLIPNFKLKLVLDEEMPPDVEADADTENGVLRIRRHIWQKLLDGCCRARFTVAHELGHFFLGHTGKLRRDKQKRRADSGTKIQEKEANIFAGYFLAPTALMKDIETADEIAREFQMSNPAAEIRYEHLQKDNRLRLGKFRSLPTNVIDFMLEQEKRGQYEFRNLSDEDRNR